MPERKSDNESILARWSRLSLRAKGVAGLSVPMTALFIAMLSIYWFEGNAPDADLSVMRAYDTRAEILQFQVFLLDAETAVSGYLATGDTRRLASYESARNATQRSLARLTSLRRRRHGKRCHSGADSYFGRRGNEYAGPIARKASALRRIARTCWTVPRS